MTVNHWGNDAIELRFAGCGHTIFIPRGHTFGHEHCYGCHPELANEPLPGVCESCKAKAVATSIDAGSALTTDAGKQS